MATRNDSDATSESAGINLYYFMTELCKLAGISIADQDIFLQSNGEMILNFFRGLISEVLKYRGLKAGFLEIQSPPPIAHVSQSNECSTTAQPIQSVSDVGSDSASRETATMPWLTPYHNVDTPIIPSTSAKVICTSTSQHGISPASLAPTTFTNSTDSSATTVFTGAVAPQNYGGNNDENVTQVAVESPAQIRENEYHGVLHRSKRNFQCHCTAKFKDYAKLKLHIRKQIEEWKFKCEGCDMQFFFQSELNKHQKSKCCRPVNAAGISDPLECNEAGVGSFSETRNQSIDEYIQHPVPSSSRQFCQRTRQRKTNQTNVKEKACARDESKKESCHERKKKQRFSRSRPHAPRHDCPDGFYHCICGSRFASKETQKQHIKYFTKEWKFKCKLCQANFHSLTKIKIHMSSKHKVENPLADFVVGCKSCGTMFRTRMDFNNHVRNAHTIPSINPQLAPVSNLSRFSGMSPRHPGMSPRRPGMSPRHPGMSPRHLGKYPRHQGMSLPNPTPRPLHDLELEQNNVIVQNELIDLVSDEEENQPESSLSSNQHSGDSHLPPQMDEVGQSSDFMNVNQGKFESEDSFAEN